VHFAAVFNRQKTRKQLGHGFYSSIAKLQSLQKQHKKLGLSKTSQSEGAVAPTPPESLLHVGK